VALILSHLGLCATLSLIGWRSLRRYPDRGAWVAGEHRRLARYALPWYGGKVSSLLFDVSTDVYLISFFLGPAAAGLYSFAYSAASQLMQLLPSTFLWPPLTAAMVGRARQDLSLTAMVFRFVSKLLLFSAVPMLAMIALLPDRIIALVFGPQYLSAATVLVAWTIVLCLRECEEPLRMLLVIKEQSHRLFWNRILIGYYLAASIILIPRFGIEGAILATGTTSGLCLLITALAARRFKPSRYPWTAGRKILLNGLVLLAFAWWVRPFLVTLPRLLIGAVLLGLGYLVVSAINKPFESDEINFVRRALPVRITRALAWLASPA
jgi:O-antigen/teichoic acid export membrane protein